MKKHVLIITASLILILVVFFVVKGNEEEVGSEIVISPSVGRFEVVIETSGELEAKNSTRILGPNRLRDYRIFQVAINDIVEEGTVVKKGDWVATLDNSELLGRLQDAQLEVDRMQSQYTQTQLDTTLQMRQTRDDLKNLEYAVSESEIELDQSKFEPPATQRQAEMNFDKSKRALQQAKDNYNIKEEQNKAKMNEVNANLLKEMRDLNGMQVLMESFRIIAPEDGMVIYTKGFDGKPVKEGSTINIFDPTVAELPDLTSMISKTYVNEVEVRKIKVGQQVAIGLNAFPEKRLNGKVIRVANVGEQRPNSDSKVFLVTIQMHENDDLLRPAMTTSNRILTNFVDSALYIPLECLHKKNDSINYIYKRKGGTIQKQEVMLGLINSNEVIIQSGLESNERVYLSIPSGQSDKLIALLPEMNGKRRSPEAIVEEISDPQTRTITLPDGRSVTIPADRGGMMPQGRKLEGEAQSQRTNPQDQK